MKFKKFMGGALAVTLALSAATGGMLSAVADTEPTAPSASEIAASEDYGYLLVHFLGDGPQAGAAGEREEQLYFTISPNAKDWFIVNGGESVSPITKSKPQGSQGGIRDPHIVRKQDGTGFYIIATDLSMHNISQDWGAAQWEGSHNIIIWEMDNEMNLTEPRMAEIAPKNAGCTWAPESIWDEEKNAYMVFWSALGWRSWNQSGSYDDPGKDWAHHVYRCYTTDFVTFTEPEIYMESEQHIIDTTILKEGDTYYRFTKVETGENDSVKNPKYGSKTVFMEEATSLSGEFRMVSTYKINGKHWSKTSGYEGAEIFKLHTRDVDDGDAQWCLALDNYGAGGYKPFITNDIATGNFYSGEMNFEVATRHGAFLPLTKGEYDALCAKWNNGTKPEPKPVVSEEPREHKEIFSMSFEDNTNVNEGSATATAYGEFEYVDGVKAGTKAVKLNGQDYISIDGSALAGLDGFTVSFAVKFNQPTGWNSDVRSWLFYAARNNDPINWSASGTHEKYVGLIWGENGQETLAAQRFWDGRTPSPSAGVEWNTTEWTHITVVFGKRYTSIFVNGEQVARTASEIDLTTILESTPTIYIGRAQWSGGEYSNCVIDEYKIHNWGMTATEVQNNYNKVMG